MRLIGSDTRLMPHLHLSLQSGDDLILKRMKRRHSRSDAIRFSERVRALRPDIVLGADLIAGFPTEADAMFESSLRLIDDCGLTFLHVFPYSARQGTPAARMPQVAGALRRERAARLRAAGDIARQTFFASRIGRDSRVLIEKIADGVASGHCEHFAPVRLHDVAAAGSVVAARITGASESELIGRLAA